MLLVVTALQALMLDFFLLSKDYSFAQPIVRFPRDSMSSHLYSRRFIRTTYRLESLPKWRGDEKYLPVDVLRLATGH